MSYQILLLQVLAIVACDGLLMPSTPTQLVGKISRRSFALASLEFDDEIDLQHEVHWLEPEMEGLKSIGEAVADGEAVICIPDVASREECIDLFSAGMAACENRGPAARGRSRFSVSDPEAFSNEVVMSCDEILLRALDHIDENIQSIYDTLFKPSEDWVWRQPLNAQLEQPTVPPPEHLGEMCDSLRELYLMGELEWSEGEPGG